jgi:hypothetical protein
MVIAQRVDGILADKQKEEQTTLYAELSLCSWALGRVGDKSSLPQVRSVCHFYTDEQGLPSGPRWQVGSGGPEHLFEAFHGLALLGEKEDALRQLQSVYDNHRNAMEPARQKEFQERLDQARRW